MFFFLWKDNYLFFSIIIIILFVIFLVLLFLFVVIMLFLYGVVVLSCLWLILFFILIVIILIFFFLSCFVFVVIIYGLLFDLLLVIIISIFLVFGWDFVNMICVIFNVVFKFGVFVFCGKLLMCCFNLFMLVIFLLKCSCIDVLFLYMIIVGWMFLILSWLKMDFIIFFIILKVCW